MAIEVVIPRLGWSMDEGTFAEWLKQDGQWVKKGDMLFVLEGEKAAQEIESFDEGILRIPADGPKTGDTVKVGQVIGYLLADGEAAPEVSSEKPQATATTTATTTAAATATAAAARPIAGPAVRKLARNLGVDLGQVAGSGPGGRITSTDVQASSTSVARSEPAVQPADKADGSNGERASTPRARRVARELGVDYWQARGSGRGGRIRERDVRALVEERRASRGGTVRKAIAARLMASFHGSVPVTLTTRADASNLEVWRRNRKWAAAEGQRVPTITDALLILVARALEKHPQMRARWDGEQLISVADVHIGLAVDTNAGLLVPVVRDVAQRSVDQIAQQTRNLAERARAGQLTMNEMQGGTFTVSNLGMFGIDSFTPILNAPEIAILGVGAIRREVVVLGDNCFGARSMLTLNLTFDHRAIDGAPAARFLQTLVQSIEEGVVEGA